MYEQTRFPSALENFVRGCFSTDVRKFKGFPILKNLGKLFTWSLFIGFLFSNL